MKQKKFSTCPRIFSLRRLFVLIVLLVPASIMVFRYHDKIPGVLKLSECVTQNENFNSDMKQLLQRMEKATANLKNLEDRIAEVLTANDQLTESNHNKSKTIQKLIDKIDLVKEGIFEPSLEYEKCRRRIKRTVQFLWYYVDYRMGELVPKCNNDSSLRDLHESLYEQKLSLLADLEVVSLHDGYEKWRRKELADLEDLVQKRLYHIQNPVDCSNAKKINCLVQTFDCGFGCQVHHVAECLAVAYGSRRTLVYTTKGNYFMTEPYYKIFQPLSNTCVDLDPSDVIEDYPGTSNSSKVLKLQNTMELVDMKVKHLPPKVPADLAPRLEKLFSEPSTWWQGQLKKYFMKLLPSLKGNLHKNFKKFGFEKPVVGIHIRRTDKSAESVFRGVEDYMKYVEEYFDELEVYYQVDQRSVYVASEDPSTIDEIIKKYPHYKVIANKEGASEANDKNNRFSLNALMGIVTDIVMLSKCDYLVCTFTSNVGRLAYELMHLENHDAAHRVKSLDFRHRNFGEPNELFVTVMNHTAKLKGETDVLVGDIVEVAGNWNKNGQFYVQNTRTGKSGVIPAFKIEHIVDTIDFPLYKNI